MLLTICELGNTFGQKFIWTTGVGLGLRDVCVICGLHLNMQYGSWKAVKGRKKLRNFISVRVFFPREKVTPAALSSHRKGKAEGMQGAVTHVHGSAPS